VDDNKARLEQLTRTFEAQAQATDRGVQALEARVDALVAEVEQRLPGVAGDLLGKARTTAADARRQVRSILTPTAS
jgi:phage shock protein A